MNSKDTTGIPTGSTDLRSVQKVPFKTDSCFNATLEFIDDSGNAYHLKDEPILVVSAIETNSFSNNTYERFKEVRRDNDSATLTFTTSEGRRSE